MKCWVHKCVFIHRIFRSMNSFMEIGELSMLFQSWGHVLHILQRDMCVGSKHKLWGLMFSQQCNWGLKFSGMWHSVVGFLTFLWNVRNHSAGNAASHLRRLESWTSVILIVQENLSRPVYVPKTATEQLKEIFEKQRNSVSSLDEKQAEWWNVQVKKLYDYFVLHFWQYIAITARCPVLKHPNFIFPLT